jgi:restriction system protein
MTITTTPPADWRDLQRQVGRILRECGLTVEIEKPMATAHGGATVDVYATETIRGHRNVILAECKHWARAVPQTVIHSFRTVVAETGANLGYVVSKAGFQSGAFSAAELTNLRLVTWDAFQAEFEETWVHDYLRPTIDARLERLIRYTEPLVPHKFLEVDDAGVERIRALRDHHAAFSYMILRFTVIGGEMFKQTPNLPLRASWPAMVGPMPDEILDARGYREFLEGALTHGAAAIGEFHDALRAGGVEP